VKKADKYTHEWFIVNGYTFDSKQGLYVPKSDYSKAISKIRESIGSKVKFNANETIGDLVIKQKVNNTPDFIAKPAVEWFINHNVPSKKNSRQNFVRNGRQISIPSKKHAEYVKLTASQYKAYGIEFRNAVEYYKLSYPLYVEFNFIRESHRRSDFTNCCQTIEDLMVSNNWLPDDDSLHLIPVFNPMEYSKETPGVRIKLLIEK
jgi:hypothetical protein